MGWSSIYVGRIHNKNEWVKDFLFREWQQDERFEPVDYSKKGNTVYMAIKRLDTDAVFATVTLISFDDGEFYWKEMDESCGPVRTECPQRILKKLTPTQYEYAREWRKKCWEYHENNNPKKYQHGQVLKFPQKISFTNGFKGDTFVLIKEGRRFSFEPYRDQTDTKGLWGTYSITKWRQLEPIIIKTLNS